MADELLTMQEAAALMRVDRSLLLRWIKMGRIRPLRLGFGREARFSRQELLRQLERQACWEFPKEPDPGMG